MEKVKVIIDGAEQTFENREDAICFLNNSRILWGLPLGSMFKYEEKWYVKTDVGWGVCTCVQVLPDTKIDLSAQTFVEVE